MANRVTIPGDVRIYYEDKGEGDPIVFIPGWTCTTEFFEHNLDVIAKEYKVIAYDPRSQGKSSITELGNNFIQRGHDLAALIAQLELNNVTLIGWSCGVLDAFSYLSSYGTNKLKALVCIDESPRILKKNESDWGEGLANELRGLLASITNPDQSTFMSQYADSMIQRETSSEEKNWIVEQSMKTPPHIAALLMADADLADYSDVARDIDGKLPVLQMLSEDAATNAQPWLEANTPNAEVTVLGGHMMFWEYPEEFNKRVLDFLHKS